MASGVVQLWGWILLFGDHVGQQRQVLGHSQPAGATPFNDYHVDWATPDSDVYFALLDRTSARAQGMTVESTTFAPQGTPVGLAAADIVRGSVGISTTPLGVSALIWDLQAPPVEEYETMEGRHDLRLSRAILVANKDQDRGRFAPSAVELRQSLFPDLHVPALRTVKWCGEWLFRCHGGPLEHDQSLIMTFGLRADDLRCLDEGVSYDMTDVGNSGSLELPLRRALLVEHVHHMDCLAMRGPGVKGKGKAGGSVSLQLAVSDESAIVSDMAKGSIMAMVSPELLAHVASVIERNVAILEHMSAGPAS
ncbi:unnamed protein product [Prorocentrum cordatum]|uniref:Uncharacterized protein n=1 Tax=Prorocentrum cordatum TaxID=2364126 RepID=A0ABN9Y7Q4_9DINO|nr:unnamed protein product [Polarella glacialis]